MTTFITLRGQFDNVGDVILRRQLAQWITGPSVTYVGAAPSEFVDGLKLNSESKVERSFWAFARAMASAPRGSSYVFKPGETQLSPAGMKENVGLIPLLGRLKSRGGSVLRVGVGARGDSPRYAALCKPSIALSDMNVWRDAHTRNVLGSGEVMPDLAFAEGSDSSSWNRPRSLLVVSVRGDRPEPDGGWLTALSDCASSHALKIVVISQVRRDDDRSSTIARRLGTRAILCGNRTSIDIEADLRDTYRHSALVVSNRLHVLIAALTEGSRVSACVPGGSSKIADHLGVVGLGDVALDAGTLPSALSAATFDAEMNAHRDIAATVDKARSEISAVRTRVQAMLNTAHVSGAAS